MQLLPKLPEYLLSPIMLQSFPILTVVKCYKPDDYIIIQHIMQIQN